MVIQHRPVLAILKEVAEVRLELSWPSRRSSAANRSNAKRNADRKTSAGARRGQDVARLPADVRALQKDPGRSRRMASARRLQSRTIAKRSSATASARNAPSCTFPSSDRRAGDASSNDLTQRHKERPISAGYLSRRLRSLIFLRAFVSLCESLPTASRRRRPASTGWLFGVGEQERGEFRKVFTPHRPGMPALAEHPFVMDAFVF